MHRFWCLIILLFCIQRVRAEILYVPSQYSTIQSAIDNALDGDNVVVSPGTYLENIDFKGKAVTVRSTDPNDPNVVAATTINGSNPPDPNFGSAVLFKSGEDNNSVLAGFTITGGTGSWLAISWDLHQIYWNRCGGGILCYNMSAPTITKNVFTGNIAGQGGGVYVYGDPVNPNAPANPAVHVSPVIADNTFINNAALTGHGFDPPNTNYPNGDHGDGGAIVGFQGVDAIIKENFIRNNYAQSYGGGVHLRQWSNGEISNNQIIDNNSTLGAGIHVTYTSSPLISHNLIRSNTSAGGGGGIYVYYYSNPVIERNFIAQNYSWYSAGIGVYWSSEPQIRDNTLVRNKGLAVLCNTGGSGTTIVTGNTIADNNGRYSTGGIRCPAGNAIIERNIITSNGGFGLDKDPGYNQTIRYNDVWGNTKGNYGPNIGDQTGLSGNISADPCFAGPDANNYHLLPVSPCTDTGDPNYTPEPNETDIDGEQRVFNAVIDIGADEVVTNHCDLNADGLVGFYELDMLADEWLHTGLDLQTDFNNDGTVNFADYAECASQWLWTGMWRL
jgi:hypothetical protein